MFTETDAIHPQLLYYGFYLLLLLFSPASGTKRLWLMLHVHPFHSFPYRTCCSYIQSRFHIHSCSCGPAVGTSTPVLNLQLQLRSKLVVTSLHLQLQDKLLVTSTVVAAIPVKYCTSISVGSCFIQSRSYTTWEAIVVLSPALAKGSTSFSIHRCN